MVDNAQMVMAGLCAKWKSPASGEEVLSCTILTCGPNRAMGELHDRMPVILAENDWPKWLGEEPASGQELLALLKSCPDEALKIWPVDNNGRQCKKQWTSANFAGVTKFQHKIRATKRGSSC